MPNFTYDGFLTAASNAGLLGEFSQADLDTARKYPEFGYSILGLKQDIHKATTPEAKLLANEAANQLRSSYGGYTGGKYGADYISDGKIPNQIDSVLDKINGFGSFTFDQERPSYENQYAEQQQALLDAIINRPDFSWSKEDDPQWHSYRKSYLREGDRATADAVCQRLADAYSYERRGIRLLKLDSSYQLCSAPEFAPYIRRAFESRRPARLSQPALEVLAIIAYYQPVTRAYVDQIRGVDSSYTVGLLLERELIEECGRLAVPGRPIQYRTTQNFLRAFGLSSLEELPELPNASPEDGQITLEMQAALEKLQAEEQAEGETADVTEEEILRAARELAQTEEAQ